MSISKEGWGKIAGAVLLAVATVISVLLGVNVQLNAAQQGDVVASQGITERINLDSFGDNQISNGGDLTFWSGAHTGQTIKLSGDSGLAAVTTLTANSATVTDLNATTITATTIVSQAVTFSGTDATLTGDVTAGTLAVGGGYGSTGATFSAAGVGQFNGALTTDGAMTAGSAVIGGGYGSTGCTLSTAGVLQCNGAMTIDGASSLVGAVTLSTNMIHSSASITPTDGGILTPTAKLITLTPAGAMGVSLGACTTGTETVLYNSVNANVVITDTGNGVLAGNQTLGQYDTLRLSCFDSKWVQESAVSAN